MKTYTEVDPPEIVPRLRPRGPFERENPISWTASAGDVLRHSQEHPPEAIIDGLLNVGSTLLLHGNEENFKSIFVLQLAESLTSGTPLLRRWAIPKLRTVGIVDTEMNAASLGVRLQRMFPSGDTPERMLFLDAAGEPGAGRCIAHRVAGCSGAVAQRNRIAERAH
jgi:AAA domain